MSKETPSQDLVYDSIRAYKEAALSDSHMFGEYDGYQAYKGDEQSLFFYKYPYCYAARVFLLFCKFRNLLI